VEKWILRQAMAGALSDAIVNHPKAKFWQGAGIEDQIAQRAEGRISDADFLQEGLLPKGWKLNSREELFYNRIFCEQFGHFYDLSWMGRSKGMPVL
jgi:hypothetical protein